MSGVEELERSPIVATAPNARYGNQSRLGEAMVVKAWTQ
jgi:hypothetical protein